MPRRMRQHVNPLSAGNLARRAAPLDLPRDRRVEVELGCGDGQFLFEAAAADPAALYVGVEIRGEHCARIAARARAAGAGDVRAVCSNLLAGVDLFPPGSVARFHVNFPDPWFKRRTHNRRWFTPGAAVALRDALAPGGAIAYRSDVFDGALEALATLEATPGLRNVQGEWRFWREPAAPGRPRSRREAWCQERGLPIWRLCFVKDA